MALSNHPGGAADKSGAAHEALWGVRAMLQVLNGEASSIRIEEPGVDGAEFYLQRENHREYWQAKRQITGQETWTLHRLDSEGILGFFFEKYRAGHHCVFASVSDAPKLRGLIDNAKASDSFEEFRAHFLGKGRSEDFTGLVASLGQPEEGEVFAFLRTMEVHGGREITLEQDFSLALATMFDGRWQATLAVLRDLYLHGSHENFTSLDIEAHLLKCGINRRTGSHADTPQRIREITQTYIAGQHANLIRRDLIRRSAAADIVRKIVESTGSLDVLVTSQAGGGKSGCLCQITQGLQDGGLLVLAFRLDRIEPVPTARMLGEKLGLDESPPVSLAHASGDKPAVLLIDQVDCVSATSGRQEEFFDTLASLLDEVAGLRFRTRIHVILACRKFDYEHDHRLKRLIPKDQQPIELGEFSDPEVQQVIASDGGDWAKLNPHQQALLKLPQNLSLFVNAGLARSAAGFSTQKDLFDAYWTAKQKAVSKGQPEFSKLWLPAIKAITETMSSRQELSLPASALDEFPIGFLDRMASEGVLTFDGRRYGFGHESFFDYCFARTQPNGGKDFVRFLKDDLQHLFRRAQLRQVLAFLRDDDRDAYLVVIGDLLRSGRIRPHLKVLAVEWLANHPESSDAELKLLEPWIESELNARRKGEANPDKFATLIWNAFFNSPGLFPVADRRGLISHWLNSGEPWLEDLAAVYLRWQTESHAGRVAELVEPFVGRRGGWTPRLRHLMEWGNLEKDRRFFDLFLKLLEDGTLDEARDRFAMNGTFWTMIHGLAGKRPDWFAELAGKWLDRQVEITQPEEEDELNPARELLGGQGGVHDLMLCANSSPESVLKFVLPVVLRAAQAFAYGTKDADELRRDRLWPLWFASSYPELRETYLHTCESALVKIGNGNPEALRPVIGELRSHRLYLANHLLLSAYLSHPVAFADEALGLLESDPERLHCGFSSSAYWHSRQVILNCSPHASEEVFRRLETTLANFAPAYEKSTGGFRQRGRAAFNFLSALANDRISQQIKIRLAEGERKFRVPDRAPRPLQVYSIESPIRQEQASFMSDDHWIRAVSKHRDERGLYDFDHPERGGADALAGTLQNVTRQDPERFARLAQRFPDGTNSSYYRNVFYALKEAEINVALKFGVVRLAFGETDHGCLCAAIDLIGAIKGDQLPDDIAGFLTSMARHSDPAADKIDPSATDGADEILTQGINSVRGHAFEAISKWIQKDRAFLNVFSPAIEGGLNDPTLAVRSCVAHTLFAVARHDVPLAFKWLGSLLEGDDRLLATPYVVEFVRLGLREHFDDLVPVIQRMLESNCEAARREGAIHACLGRLHNERAEVIANKALTGDTACRLGASEVAATNFPHPDCRTWCEQVLLRQFNDQEPEVRHAATGCFWHLRKASEISVSDFDDLIRSFTASPAFAEDPSNLLYALEDTVSQVPSAILEVCEAFVARCSEQARDLRNSRHGDERIVGKLVFTAYAQLKGQEAQGRALNLIDKMILEGLYSTSGHLAEAER